MPLSPLSDSTWHPSGEAQYQALDAPPEAAFEHVLRLAARVFGVPIVQVCLESRDKQGLGDVPGARPCFGIDTRAPEAAGSPGNPGTPGTPGEAALRGSGFVAPALECEQVLVVGDALGDSGLAGEEWVGANGIAFYAGAPLRSRSGHRFGTLWLGDLAPRAFGERDSATLGDLALVVVDEIELWVAGHRTRGDVLERERGQVALRASEERARSIIEAAHDAFVGMDARGVITDWNRRAEETFGWARSEVVGRSLAEAIVPPRYRAAHFEGIVKYLQTGEGPVLNRVIEISAVHRDGREFPVELSITPVGVGQEKLFTAFVRDISERKRVEAELVESKRFAESVTEHSTNIIYVFDLAQGKNVYFNRSMALFLGYEHSPSGFVGSGLGKHSLYDLAHPDDLAMLEEKQAQMRASTAERAGQQVVEAVVEYEMRFMNADGRWRWLWNRETVLARGPDGTPTQILGTAQDVTERKEATQAVWDSQRRFAAFMRHVPGVAFMKDVDGAYTYVNDTFERLFGVSMEGLRGITDYDIWPAEFAGPFVAHDREVLRLKSASQIVETVPGEDGVGFWLSSKFPILDDHGNAVMLGGVSIDITERVHAERQLKEFTALLEERVAQRTAELAQVNHELRAENERRAQVEVSLRRAKDEAEAANQAKNEFLSRTSHELRTPLNAILGFGQLLELDALEPDQAESVHHILTAGRHLLHLINQVLDIARIEERALGLVREPIAIAPALRTACDMVRIEAARRSVRIVHEEPAPGVAVTGEAQQAIVVADRQKLHQILLNLLSNAVKYNHEGGQVFVSCRPEPLTEPLTEPVPSGTPLGGAGWVRISVRDTGLGIEPSRMGDMFMPFNRLGAEKTGVEGVGLGLSLCKSLAEAMGGAILVESEPGVGSTFSLRLPSVPYNPEEPPST